MLAKQCSGCAEDRDPLQMAQTALKFPQNRPSRAKRDSISDATTSSATPQFGKCTPAVTGSKTLRCTLRLDPYGNARGHAVESSEWEITWEFAPKSLWSPEQTVEMIHCKTALSGPIAVSLSSTAPQIARTRRH